MSDGKVTVSVRYALLYYFNKRLRLDVAAHLDSPHERPVIVANHIEFSEALAKATAQPDSPKDHSALRWDGASGGAPRWRNTFACYPYVTQQRRVGCSSRQDE